MHVGTLITNYKAWPLTSKAITELRRWSNDEVSRVVVVDDASDAPLDAEQGCGNVLVNRNPQNLGYVRSVNVGMKLMTEEVVLVLDCDAYPLMNLIPRIVEHFTNEPRLGALGFCEVSPENKMGLSGEGEPTLTYFLLGQAVGSWAERRGWFIGERRVLHSCCMAVRRSAFENVGGFDEEFDFLDADIDFSMRLQDAGWLVRVDEGLRCFHQGAGSPQATSHRVIRFHRNRWRLLRKHRRLKWINLCRLVLCVRHAAECVALLLLCGTRPHNNEGVREKLRGRWQLLCSINRYYV